MLLLLLPVVSGQWLMSAPVSCNCSSFIVDAATYYADKQLYDGIILWLLFIDHQQVKKQQVLQETRPVDDNQAKCSSEPSLMQLVLLDTKRVFVDFFIIYVFFRGRNNRRFCLLARILNYQNDS